MAGNAAIIVVLIMERPLCIDCIADKANLTTTEAGVYTQAIGKTIELHADEGRCHACGNVRPVFAVRPLER